MTIKEVFIQGKKGDLASCEDGYIVKPNFVAIIDGVTSKSEFLYENKTSGFYAKEVILSFLAGEVEMYDSIELFKRLSQELKKEMRTYKVSRIEDKLRASVVVYNDIFHEIWSYGDCKYRIDDVTYLNEKKIDQILSSKRIDIINAELKKGTPYMSLRTNDIGRNEIMNELKSQFQYENKKGEFGYPVINGDDIVEDMIKKHKVNSGVNIILATDGYPNLCNTLEQSEKQLRKIIENDPLCIEIYKTTKGVIPGNQSFDDRCYCSFIV